MFKVGISKKMVLSSLVVLTIIGLSGCGGTNDTPVVKKTNTSLIGEWYAKRSYFPNSGQDIDLFASVVSPSVTLTVKENNMNFEMNQKVEINQNYVGTVLEPYINSTIYRKVISNYYYVNQGVSEDYYLYAPEQEFQAYKIDVENIKKEYYIKLDSIELVQFYNDNSEYNINDWELNKYHKINLDSFPELDKSTLVFLYSPHSLITVIESGELCMTYQHFGIDMHVRNDYPYNLSDCVLFERVSSAQKSIRW